MPIKPSALQRRLAEQGRIRLGAKRGGNGAPMKLESFRFTSPNERHIRDLAELYGGEARAWDNGGKSEFEVFTDVNTIPVIAVKGAVSQWLETWSGGGCVHRCDGEVNVLTGEPCNPDDPAHKNAKPTTRLGVMLPELESIGVWRMESHGWNAAAEIPAVAELAQFVGDMVPAHLNLVERRAIKDGKTSRFVVPVLDLQIGTARLRELVAEKAGLGALEAPASDRPALTSGAGDQPAAEDPFAPFLADVAATKALDDLAGVWEAAKAAGLVGPGAADTPQARNFVQTFQARAHELKDAELQQEEAAAQPDADGIVEAELVEEGDAGAVWQQILSSAGGRQWTEGELREDFAQQMGGLDPNTASVAELQHYLGLLTGERAA
jgi:hypothetical protein